MSIFRQSTYVTCVYNSFWSVGMVSLVDIAAGDVLNIDFVHSSWAIKELQLATIWWFMLYSSEKRYLKYINSYYIYWEILHLPNFSNNKLLHLVILLLPFAKCFISINECLIKKAKTLQYSYFWLPNLHYFF